MIDFSTTSPFTAILFFIVLLFFGAIISEKLKVSYTTVIIAVGLLFSFLGIVGNLGSINLDRNIILGLVLPPLIFAAAMRTRFEVFMTVQKTVLSLAILGVIISAIVSSLALYVVLRLPLAAALAFGVIVSPTDPVSIVNILKKARAPERLSTILETEAFFNDATSVILYPIALSLPFSPLRELELFGYTFGVGILVGLLVSAFVELLYRQVTEPLAKTVFTIAIIFGSYFFAQSVGASGLVAVAIAGLYMGNRTMGVAMSKEDRKAMINFWEVLTFMATSFAFLLIGLKTDFQLLIANFHFILVAFAAIFLARIFSVYPITEMMKLVGERIPSKWTRILALAGLRGAVSVALALSLPESSFKNGIVAMTFGVVLLSLVVQGEILQRYLKRMIL